MFKNCPNCTREVAPDWKCCPYCGYKFEEVGASTTESPNATSALDDMINNVMGSAGERQADEDRRKQDAKLRVMIIRGLFDEAKKVCDDLLENDPMDKVGYIGLIRIASKNFKEYEGEEIAEQIRVAEEVFGGADELCNDAEYAKYISARKQYFEQKEQEEKEARKREEEERKAREAEEARKKKEEEEQLKRFLSICDVEVINGKYEIIGVIDETVTSIDIPECVTSIGEDAFYGCSGLTSITIPNSVTSIGSGAFYDCTGLTSITIPNSVTSIGSGAFDGCTGLTSITIPNSVTTIGEYAFPDSCKVNRR